MNILDAFFNKTEYIFDKSLDFAEKSFDVGFKVASRIAATSYLTCKKILDTVQSITDKNGLILRYAGFPYSILIPYIWKIYIMNRTESLPTDKEGIHFFRAPVGGGKSLTSFVLAERALKLTGFASYFSSAVEKPMLSEDGKYYYVMHKVQKLEDVYVDGKRAKEWDYEKYPYVNKDERHLRYNPRVNKSKKYNEAWLLEHEDELLMRHEGAKRIYKFSQHMKLDGQEMETAIYMHDIAVVKGLPYSQWLKDGKLRIYPYRIKFETFVIDYGFDGSVKRKLIRKWSLPVPMEVLDRFDTHAERRTKKKNLEVKS